MKSIVYRTKALFKIRFLRNILLISLIGTLSMPLIVRFVISPMFASYLVSITEDDALRVATHLAQTLDVASGSLTHKSIPDAFIARSDSLLKTLRLKKIRIFALNGEALFSTDRDEIGELNEKPYFLQEVAKGHLYSQVVQKSRMTAEGEIATADVVETYVPIRDLDGEVGGAFEIYFEITERWATLKEIMHWSAMGLMIVVILILAALFFALIHAAEITLKRQREQIELQLAADVMANTEEGIIVTDANGVIESVNRAFTELTGYTLEEAKGKNPRFLQSGRHNKKFFEAL